MGQKEIYEWLKEHPNKSSDEIAEAMKQDIKTVRVYLTKMYKVGLVTRETGYTYPKNHPIYIYKVVKK